MTVYQYAEPYVPGNYVTAVIDDADLPTYLEQGWVTEPPPDIADVSVPPGTFFTADLACDEDLTAWESKMPAMADRAGAYAGKRTLAKNFVYKTLLKRGVDPSELDNPTQLKDAAVFKELELIFRDMSQTPEDIAGKKASHYSSLFESELELIILTITTAANNATTVTPTMTSIPLYLA